MNNLFNQLDTLLNEMKQHTEILNEISKSNNHLIDQDTTIHNILDLQQNTQLAPKQSIIQNKLVINQEQLKQNNISSLDFNKSGINIVNSINNEPLNVTVSKEISKVSTPLKYINFNDLDKI